MARSVLSKSPPLIKYLSGSFVILRINKYSYIWSLAVYPVLVVRSSGILFFQNNSYHKKKDVCIKLKRNIPRIYLFFQYLCFLLWSNGVISLFKLRIFSFDSVYFEPTRFNLFELEWNKPKHTSIRFKIRYVLYFVYFLYGCICTI